MYLQTLDYTVVAIYAVVLLVLAQWVSREKSRPRNRTSSDYFLAGRNLPWWAIGASLIAAIYFSRADHRHVRVGICPGHRNWRL